MSENILIHYKNYGLFTYPGCYTEYLKSELTDDIREIGELVRHSFIHRTTLEAGNTGTNTDKKYGDMEKVPWWQQPQDDYLVTVGAILTELFRKDERGFTKYKKETDKLILTCRFVAIVIAAILKSKGISCRVRSGFAPYFTKDNLSWDHWINQYWNSVEKRWMTIDVDGSWHGLDFDPYDIPDGKFDYSAKAWLDVRSGKVDEDNFHNAGGFKGLYPIAWELIYDFHCLMNNEIIYLHGPATFASLKDYNEGRAMDEPILVEVDKLAELMMKPDDNFQKLKMIWETNKRFRTLKGALL
jgi:hypothetical protein